VAGPETRGATEPGGMPQISLHLNEMATEEISPSSYPGRLRTRLACQLLTPLITTLDQADRAIKAAPEPPIETPSRRPLASLVPDGVAMSAQRWCATAWAVGSPPCGNSLLELHVLVSRNVPARQRATSSLCPVWASKLELLIVLI
jgi:hypothetical protein